MNRPLSSALAALVTLPLLAAAIVLPAALDTAISPLAAGGAPLAWAAIVITATRLKPAAAAVVFATALPFSAYALAAFGQPPSVPWLFAMAASTAAAVAVRAAGSVRKPAQQAQEENRVRVATLMALGAAPGLVLAQFATPWSGGAVSVLVAAVALLAHERSRR